MAESPKREEIEIRAFEIYLEQGCPEGKALEHWLAAEQELEDLGSANETKTVLGASQKSAAAGGGGRP